MRYYIIAGEASGDLHGSNLVKGLSAEDPKAEFRVWGGDMMLSAAQTCSRPIELVRHYKEGAVMGLNDVLRKGLKILGNLELCQKDILSWKPDVVILIDYPGFNMKIAKFCHEHSQKVFYYIVPKTWASREGRNRDLKAWVDKLFIVFPFEVPYFQSHGMDFIYEGNPLVDAIDNHEYTRPESGRYIALLVGSRKGEITRMLPSCMEMVDRLSRLERYKGHQFVIAGAPARSEEDYLPLIGGRENVKLVFGRTYDVLRFADAAVINSGTASLEAALIGTPQVVGWNTNPLTFFLCKNWLRIQDHIRYISLGNLCIDKLAFKEFLQDDLNSDNLTAEVRRLVEDQSYRETMLSDYDAIRKSLGGSGASRKVAKAMIEEIGRRKS